MTIDRGKEIGRSFNSLVEKKLVDTYNNGDLPVEDRFIRKRVSE